MSSINYKDAGVDISAGNEAVNRIKPLVERTFSPDVQTEIGAFAALYDLKNIIQNYHHPLLVQSMDGVGTKTIVARMMQKFDTLGQDLVSATANDIVVMGAKPLTLLDYIAADKLNPVHIEAIIRGMAEACYEEGIALTGGETAEMPGTYCQGEHDLVGIITGVVEKEKVVTGKTITPGDIVLGLASNGLHTNGYSLARKLFFEKADLDVDSYHAELGDLVGTVLLAPHRNYCKPILGSLEKNIPIKGMAHITGGGFLENIPRVLPADCAVEIQSGTWPIPPVFTVMQQLGNLAQQDLFRTFNMGIGMVLIVDESAVDSLQTALKAYPDHTLYAIGQVISASEKTVRIL